MNKISTYQEQLDFIAFTGTSCCQILSKKTPVVHIIGINILLGGIGAAAFLAFPPAAPILGITTVGMIAYNVYAIYQRIQQSESQKKLAPLKDIFSSIQEHQYELAWNQLEKAIQFQQSDSLGNNLLKFRTQFNLTLELLNKGIRDPECDFYPVLFCYTALMKAREEYSKVDFPKKDLKNLVAFVQSQNAMRKAENLTPEIIEELIQEVH